MVRSIVVPLLLAFIGGVVAGTIVVIANRSRRAAIAAAAAGFLITASLTTWALYDATRATGLRITEPSDNAMVGYRPVIRGTKPPGSAKIYLLVRPLSNDQWWVQDPVIADERTWQVGAYIGTPTIGVNESYAIVAIAASRQPLARLVQDTYAPGERVAKISPSFAQSNIVTVRRTR